MSEKEKNHFILKSQFPKIESLLKNKGKEINDLVTSALFVIDANSLLVPYNTGKENIDKIKKVYKKLIKDDRLYIPAHVLREFVKIRSYKISDLYTNIENLLSSIPTIKHFEYPILGELQAYNNLKESMVEFNKITKVYKQQLQELKSGITNLNWADPVSSMYFSTFKESIIIEITEPEADSIKEYNRRIYNDIPPGNRDKAKENNAIGDYIIWKCILELGKNKKRDIVFVSNDEKNDWLLKGDKKSISTKFELVDEFFRETNGQAFACMTFSDFLESQGLEIDILEEVDLKKYFKNKTVEKGQTVKLLEKINNILEHFLIHIDEDEEDIYIDDSSLDDYIAQYQNTYKDEYFGTEYWNRYFSHLYFFSEVLSEIGSLNSEIIYQAHRMKRGTQIEQIKLRALAIEFTSKFNNFIQLL